jgi:hypothetical protein
MLLLYTAPFLFALAIARPLPPTLPPASEDGGESLNQGDEALIQHLTNAECPIRSLYALYHHDDDDDGVTHMET